MSLHTVASNLSVPAHSDALLTRLKNPPKVGDTVVRLTFLGPVFGIPEKCQGGVRRRQKIVCECLCGEVVVVNYSNVLQGFTMSCGCFNLEQSLARNTTMGGLSIKYPKLYQVRAGMLSRCYDTEHTNYPAYGGRGIQVCELWRKSLKDFIAWSLTNGYKEGLQLDREDTNKNYSPDNCRYVTAMTNANNRRNCVKVTAFGETMTVAQWDRDARCGVTRATFCQRLKAGVPPEQAMSPHKIQRKRQNGFSLKSLP